jgi:hypothetical protein
MLFTIVLLAKSLVHVGPSFLHQGAGRESSRRRGSIARQIQIDDTQLDIQNQDPGLLRFETM